MSSSSAFADENTDPFLQEASKFNGSIPGDANFEPSSSCDIHVQSSPRWTVVQTDQEQAESQKTVQALEAKLKRMKQRSRANYMNVDEHEESLAPNGDEEGVHLLWKTRADENGNDAWDEAFRRRKHEEEFTWYCCACLAPLYHRLFS